MHADRLKIVFPSTGKEVVFFFCRAFSKTNKKHFSVFLLSYRNTPGSLGEL